MFEVENFQFKLDYCCYRKLSQYFKGQIAFLAEPQGVASPTGRGGAVGPILPQMAMLQQ
jgi:hypothetical protein